MNKTKNKNGPVVLVTKDISYTFPFGYAYLAGYLIEKGEEVIVLFRPKKAFDYKKFVQDIIELKPVLVGFGTLYPDLYPIKKLIELLNLAGRNFPIVIGGQMVTPTPEFAVKITGADFGVVGEGEIIVDELVKTLRKNKDPHQVKGVIINENGKLSFTESGDFIKYMAKLPKIPYTLFPSNKWLDIGRFYVDIAQPHWRYNDKVVAIHGGRGCPFNCNFCYHHSLSRYRSINDMFEEIKVLIKKYDANMLYFGDDLVLATPTRVKELTQAIRQLDKKVEYSVSCRFDILDRISDEMLREMKETGCRIMGLGIESGSQRILDIIDKRITTEQIIKGMRRLKDAGILPTVSIMVGQYTETVEDVQKSIDLMLETLNYNKNVNYAFTICTPFPGTKLYNVALEKKLIKDDFDFYKKFDPDKEIGGLSVNLSAMNDKEVVVMHRKISDIYLQRKKDLIGRKVMLVEATRHFVYRVYNKITKTIIDKLPEKSVFILIKKLYHNSHNAIQFCLDRFRLYLLDVR
ncbi:MAG: radical SAM protein [Candidatus Zambryskibacteria bacterium]|nr:radical SAM protein [Candidatus Zambryskibacteria bacterium]